MRFFSKYYLMMATVLLVSGCNNNIQEQKLNEFNLAKENLKNAYQQIQTQEEIITLLNSYINLLEEYNALPEKIDLEKENANMLLLYKIRLAFIYNEQNAVELRDKMIHSIGAHSNGNGRNFDLTEIEATIKMAKLLDEKSPWRTPLTYSDKNIDLLKTLIVEQINDQKK